ncbi:MAG TPA: hypothetical protein PKV73_01180 [Agriterribacter sp.]|nr:hypothetical protein [Agriterribacter sp.]
MNVELKINFYTIKLFIDGYIHLFIWRKDFVGFQSWSDGNDKCTIEFYTKTNKITLEQDTKEKWLTILKELNNKL